jgi:hypothetical protein
VGKRLWTFVATGHFDFAFIPRLPNTPFLELRKMKYLLCTLMAAAIVMLAGSTSRADNGIPKNSLSDMGLSGLTEMTDSEALSVRGQGAFAGGISWAVNRRGSGSINVYGAKGKYEASGKGGSIAGSIYVRYKDVDNSDGSSNSELKIRGYAVFAGGFSSARSF